MGAEHLDQTCATEDDCLCGNWLLVASWWFPTSCCDVVGLGEVPPQVSTSSRWKGDYTLILRKLITKHLTGLLFPIGKKYMFL